MPTPYEDIIDLAYISIDDYKIEEIRQTDNDSFLDIMSAFLIRGMILFTNYPYDFDNRDDDLLQFNDDMDYEIKSILADCTVISWYDQKINNTKAIVALMNNKTEAHRYSEANLLDKNMLSRSIKYEELQDKIRNYSLKTFDYTTGW